MDRSFWPVLLIEGVLVFGGALGFAWWQLREIERDRREAARRRSDEKRQTGAGGEATPAAGKND
jgi:hypothetical protein